VKHMIVWMLVLSAVFVLLILFGQALK